MRLFAAAYALALLCAVSAFAKTGDSPARCLSDNQLLSVTVEEDKVTHKLYGYLSYQSPTTKTLAKDTAYIDVTSHSPFIDTYTAVDFYLEVRNHDPSDRRCGTESKRLCTGHFEGTLHGEHISANFKCFKDLK